MSLSTERVQFEAALAAILATMGGGTGLITPTRQALIDYTKAKLDEVVPGGEGFTFALSAEPNISNPLDLLINAHADESTKDVCLSAPISVLFPTLATAAGVANTDAKTGYVILPDNFLRLSSFKMTDWLTDIDLPITPKDPKYKKQSNQYLRGGVSKPIAVLTWKGNSSIPTTIVKSITNGYLYNWFAATDARNISNTGWHVPTFTEWQSLYTGLGGQSIAGGKLKEIGFVHWETPNTEANNESGFNAIGAGYRIGNYAGYEGVFSMIKKGIYLIGLGGYGLNINFNSSVANALAIEDNTMGYSLRLLKNSTTLTHGQTGTYTGNDGRIYKTICIGTQEWLSENLAETKYRNGDLIPKVTDNTAWSALTTGAMCAYNNDEANAFADIVIAPTIGTAMKRILEYYSIDTLHTVEKLLYVPETTAEDFIAVNPNLMDSLAWMIASKVLQITGMADAAKLAQERVTQSYNNL